MACAEGNRYAAERAVRDGADPDWADNDAAGPVFQGTDSWVGTTPLYMASRHGHVGCVALLLNHGAQHSLARRDGLTPLCTAAAAGHTECVKLLCAAGSSLLPGSEWQEYSNLQLNASEPWPPLHKAAENGHLECVEVLMRYGALVNAKRVGGRTAMYLAVQSGHLTIVQLLSSYGADRQFSGQYTNHRDAPTLAVVNGHVALANWLFESRRWCSPLHHLSIMCPDRALALLRRGASLDSCYESVTSRHPTPRSLAPVATPAGAATLVLRAAQPWSPSVHHLFPKWARRHARDLLCIGFQLSRLPKFAREEQAIMDTWRHNVMPHVITRPDAGRHLPPCPCPLNAYFAHGLRPMDPIRVYKNPTQNGRWKCDMCFQEHFGGPMLHCEVSRFDLCLECDAARDQ
jgi:ankyrin repeat protein